MQTTSLADFTHPGFPHCLLPSVSVNDVLTIWTDIDANRIETDPMIPEHAAYTNGSHHFICHKNYNSIIKNSSNMIALS